MLVKEERKAKKANKSGRNARKKERQAEVGEDYSWQLTPTPSSTPLSSDNETGRTGQIEVNNAEASLFCNFLSHTRLCNGCLRYSMKTHKCGRCKSVVYCSQQCLEGDWPNHKFSCAVFAETQSSLRGSRRLTDTSKRIHEKLAISLIGRMDPYVYDSMKWIGMEPFFDEPSDERMLFLFNADFREFLEARGSQRDIKSGNNE